ncbi:hypothetical protein OJ996_01305 [Luteolibacter sp. GHJ8]|jgi:hypothetical protein|uniref:Uncharacterized protein n=1 Tax=Luteolibacter rhizosphaerae TaxID=2989719 RepID=A0ABT3FXW3_9BACT|nr:hypothetical protein [Luteolibacter rhizosphaerae]MCW1912189.1 hypothetical protein [Luteolibacter rhizosphaerae]
MNPVEPGPGFVIRHPRLFLAFSFLLLAGVWSTLILVAAAAGGR